MKFLNLQKIILFTLFWISIPLSFSQTISLSKEGEISVLTCGTSTEVYALFGHTAIRVKDKANGIDVVYNYGAFDFGTPNFALKFAKGNLQYFAVANSYTDFIANYSFEKRSVYEQILRLSATQKQRLFDLLNESLLLENREYTYKFIDQNCTSMTVDVINKALTKNIIIKKGDTTTTYRSILFPYFNNHFYEQLGTSILFGTKTDQAGTAIFLPFELKESLDQIRINQLPIVKENRTLLKFEPKTNPSWWNNPYTYLIVLAFVLLINKKTTDTIYLASMGILGIVFIILGFYSTHLELGNNYNILLFNPFLIVILAFAKAKNVNGIRYTVWLNLFALVIYSLLLINKPHLWIVAPLIITSSVVLVRGFWKKEI